MAMRDEQMTVLVVSHNDGLLRHLQGLSALSEREGGFPCRIRQAHQLEIEPASAPPVVLIDLEASPPDALEQLPRLRREGVQSWIVVTGEDLALDQVLIAMRSGANDCLTYRPTPGEFGAMLSRAATGLGRVSAKPQGRIITVASNTGGVGTTMLSINLAAALGDRLPERVAVVDLVLQHGDVSTFLDVPTAYSVVNLVAELDRVDGSYLKSVLPKHQAGIYVVPSPTVPDEAELVTSAQTTRLLQKLSAVFDLIIVDAGNEFNNQTLAAFDLSEQILLVTLPSLPAIRNTKRALELFGRLPIEQSRIRIVLNRSDAKGALPLEDIEHALARPVEWRLPNEYATLVRAINQGTTVKRVEPRGPLALSFEAFVMSKILEGRTDLTPPDMPERWQPLEPVRNLLKRFNHGTT